MKTIQDKLHALIDHTNDPILLENIYKYLASGISQQKPNLKEMGLAFEDDDTARKILITKHNALYYEFNATTIISLKIVDTRSKACNT